MHNAAVPFQELLEKQVSQNPLPGANAWQSMEPQYRHTMLYEVEKTTVPGSQNWRPAAVLIIIYPQNGQWHFPLIVRSHDGGVHSGQLALPGGALETGESAETCALRECAEELGVNTSHFRLLRTLTPLPVPPSRFIITPVVAITTHALDCMPNPREVQEVLPYAMQELHGDLVRGQTMRVFQRHEWHTVPCIMKSRHRIWGATAMILAEFAALTTGFALPVG